MGTPAYQPSDSWAPWLESSIGELLDVHARTYAERPVAFWPEGDEVASMSYSELHTAAVAAARGLLGLAEPGDRVAIWAPNSIDWYVVEVAAAMAGVVLTPINPALRDGEVEHILATSGTVAVLAAAEHRGKRLAERAAALAPGLGKVDRVVELASWRADLVPGPTSASLPRVAATDPFLIQYTSGTTGRPKGAVLSHRAALNAAHLSALRLTERHDAPLRWCSPLPLHHVGMSVCVALATLTVGGALVMAPQFDADLVLRLIEQTEANVFGGVPTMALDLLAHPDRPRRELGRLRAVMIGGSPVAPSLVRRLEDELDVAFVNGYGQSEAPSSLQTDVGDDDRIKAETIGRPLPHREVRIARTDTGETAAMGEAGELCIRGPVVMDGYWADAAATAATIDADGWLHTGDLCSMDEAGHVRLHGRVRDLIIRGGENIYPAEVEDVLLRHPAVADVAVVRMPDERWGEQPAAFVKPVPGRRVTVDELDAHARRQLASFKVPRRYELVDAFPVTASGKVKKFELEQRLLLEEKI